MIERDREEFAEMIRALFVYYGKAKDLSPEVLDIYWTCLRPFDLPAVRKALGQHALNPDTGSFLPKVADVVKMLGGSTLDSALVAWSKFEAAIQSTGTYMTVVFDDPLIHRVVEDMGGWTILGRCTTKDWPFRQNEFVNRYRGWKVRGETPPYPPRLIGIYDGDNSAAGYQVDDRNVRLIGDHATALKVLAAGSNVPRLPVTPLAAAIAKLELKR